MKFPCVLAVTLTLSACATVRKNDIEVIDHQPQAGKILSEPVSARFLKRKIAIARFTNETKYGQNFFLDENRNPIGKQATDILSAKLAGTGKFLLLERADIEQINKEIKLGSLENLSIPADYLIVGSISEFGRKTTSDTGVFSRTKKQQAFARVNIRLIDVSSGQILFSAEGSGEAFSEAGTVMGVGGEADYDSTLNDRAISAAIGKLVNNIIENLLDRPWRSYILSHESGNYIISGGKSQGIRQGDIFGVYRRGKKVKNPQTGITIELPGQLIGKIKVEILTGNDPNSEVSICSVVSGSLPEDNLGNVYVRELDEKSGGAQ